MHAGVRNARLPADTLTAMSGVDVSVLVPVLNEAANLRACAARMLAQDLDGEAEFLFIDGGSDDGSDAILASLPKIASTSPVADR